MKKFLFIFLISFITLSFAFNNALYAATTPTVSTSENIQQKLLDQIASKAAQLKLTEKRGIIGVVSEATDTQITLTDVQGNKRFVDVDELTKFSSPTSNTFGISDVKSGMTVGALGLYNRESRRLLARDVDILTLPKIVIGSVHSLDNKNFQFVVDTQKDSVKIDVENITKTYAYSEGTLASSGFSKININEPIVVLGYPDATDKSMILASKVLLFPDSVKDPRIISAVSALDNSITIVPSTGSGKKLTPIVK